MPYSIHDASIIVAKNALDSLSSILSKAQDHPNNASLLQARLAPDMLPLTFQVFMVTDLALKIVTRTSGADDIKLESNMTLFDDFNARLADARTITTFDDCHSRIASARAILEDANEITINAKTDDLVPIGLGPGKITYLASKDYITGFALPNILFHLTTAYGILRKEGVPLCKSDYQESFLDKYLPADF